MLDQGWPLNVDRSGPVWSWFDADRYACLDATAMRAARTGPQAALDDYEDRGALLGYAPNVYFDPAYYVSANPYVDAGIQSGDFRCAFDHYRLLGWRDRDPHWLFSVSRYSSQYPDLTADAVDHLGGLYGHYLQDGCCEGRSAHQLFDPSWYLGRLPAEEAATAIRDPYGHFLRALEAATGTGQEPQASPFFDPAWYRATYPDVSRPTGKPLPGVLYHYVTVGASEGRDPLCDFSEDVYQADNPDVALAVRQGHFSSGYEHFLSFGAIGLRSPNREVNLAWYAAQPRVARDLASGRYAHAFAHLLLVGITEGLALQPPLPDGFALAETDGRALFISAARRALPGYGRRPLKFGTAAPPELSVILVLRNQFALTMQCLASLRQNFAGSLELVIVDNASSDATINIGELVHGARVIRLEENVGFLRACNLALQEASAPTVLYLNNDVTLHPGALRAGLDRLAIDASVGAVGGKIIRTHGLLQEAGCLLWRDGSAEGWMRDAPPDAPEACYVREVDFCSGAFLMVRGSVLRALGGFDDAFAPAYYEEVDLCLRIRAAGSRVVYDPAIELTHYEYGSSRSARAATALMVANRSTLRCRHAAALRSRVGDRRLRAHAAALSSAGRRVLFIEDTVPLARLGSGYPRASDTLLSLIEAGWQASVFPMQPIRMPLQQITAALPDTAEVLWDRDHRVLETFLEQRRGYYDLIWVSRAHNLRRLLDIAGRSGIGLEGARLVLDTEALFSVRDATKAELDGLPFSLPSALAQEFEGAWQCDHVVAVSDAEAEVLRSIGLGSVSVVGLATVPGVDSHRAGLPPAPWSERRGVLHVGAMTALDTPNVDGLRWYLDEVQPQLENLVDAAECRLTLVGPVSDDVDLSWLRRHPAVDFVGPVADLGPVFARHRAFVAPTRYGAGLPIKIATAGNYGLPSVTTNLMARLLGWKHEKQILAAPIHDPAQFASQVARLLMEQKTWTRVRNGSQEFVRAEFSRSRFASQVEAAVEAAGARIKVR